MKKVSCVCDYCNKAEVPDETNSYDGLLLGWINVEAYMVVKDESDLLDAKYAKGHDFCSQACLMQWVQSPERPWNHI